MNVNQLQHALYQHIDAIALLITAHMKTTGDSEIDCQRLCILNRLNTVTHYVNGIEQNDLEQGQ